jgi:Tol biopolymer transport system component
LGKGLLYRIATVWFSSGKCDTVGLYLYDIEKDSIYPFIVKLPPFLVSSPSFSPDGEWIVFCWSAQIWKIKEDTDSLTQLTSSGSNFFPRWSPDGKLISHDKTTDSMGVWIINSDGAPVKHIYIYGRYPSWNPSGDKILFVGYNGGGGSIASIDTTGENFNRILKESDINAVALHYPRYSPGGSKIVFCAQREGEGRMVWVMEADGSNPVALAAGNMPDWSPDGRKIIYSNNKVGGIWIMDTNGCNKEILIDEFN